MKAKSHVRSKRVINCYVRGSLNAFHFLLPTTVTAEDDGKKKSAPVQKHLHRPEQKTRACSINDSHETIIENTAARLILINYHCTEASHAPRTICHLLYSQDDARTFRSPLSRKRYTHRLRCYVNSSLSRF